MTRFLVIISVFMASFSGPASAYIGPGLGAGTVGVILGVLGSILLALFAIFWYPLKRLFKKDKNSEQITESQQETETATETVEDGKE